MAITTIESELGGANRYQSSVGNVSGFACQVWEAGSGHHGESSKHLRKFRVGTLNVNTLRDRVYEIVETLSRSDSHLMSKSGNVVMQIDFILFRRAMRKLVTDVKVIPGKEAALQYQLLVCDITDVPPKSKRKFTPRLKVWKLKDLQTSNHFQEVFNWHVSASAAVAATEDIWNNIKTGLLKTTEVCGTTRPHP